MPSFWTWVTVGLEVGGAFTLLLLMQLTTSDANWHTHYGRCLWMRRIVKAPCAMFMAWHAGYILEHSEVYTWADAGSIAAPMIALIAVSFSYLLNERKMVATL